MLTQNLPSSASDYSRRQRAEIKAALAAIDYEWSRMGVGGDFDIAWSRISSNVEAILRRAQRRLIRQAVAYTPAVLEDTGQLDSMLPLAEINPAGLVGLTGAGMPVGYVTSYAPIRAKQAVEKGADPFAALTQAGNWLAMTAMTTLSDTGRAVESLGMYAHETDYYVRMLVPPSCGRCVILAGRRYRLRDAFPRHPECDCRHIPASEALAGDLTVDPRAYFDSLDEAGQAKFVGSKANAAAVRDGADINQLVNAYRRSRAGLSIAQTPLEKRYGLKFTTAGATDRSWTAQQQVGLGQRSAVRSATPRARLMPESVYANAASRDDALQMLRSNGWILDPDARRAGRAALDAQVLRRRTARAATRRAIRREERLATAARASTDTPDMNALRDAVAASKARRGPTSRNASPLAQPGGTGSGSRPPRAPRAGGGASDDANAYWRARQELVASEYGLDFKGDTLKPQEIAFVERFVGSGRRIEWISNQTPDRSSSLDFTWLDEAVDIELKATKAKHSTVRNAIHKSVKAARVNHGVTKDHFIIDLADQPLTDDLRNHIADYNLERSRYPIRRVWVWSRERLEEITLRT